MASCGAGCMFLDLPADNEAHCKWKSYQYFSRGVLYVYSISFFALPIQLCVIRRAWEGQSSSGSLLLLPWPQWSSQRSLSTSYGRRHMESQLYERRSLTLKNISFYHSKIPKLEFLLHSLLSIITIIFLCTCSSADWTLAKRGQPTFIKHVVSRWPTSCSCCKNWSCYRDFVSDCK